MSENDGGGGGGDDYYDDAETRTKVPFLKYRYLGFGVKYGLQILT